MNKLVRWLLAPIVLLCGIFFTAAMCLFPIPLIIGFNFFGLISYLFVKLINIVYKNLEPFELFQDITGYTICG